MCDLHESFDAYCLHLWFDLSPAKEAKSAIYDCLVQVVSCGTVALRDNNTF